MKKRLFTTAAFLITLATATLFAQADTLTLGNEKGGQEADKRVPLHKGEIVTLALAEDISSDKANVGDVVKMIVTMDVQSEGFVLIKKGCYGEAIVRDVKRARSFGRGGQLVLEVDNVTAFDGRRIALQGKSLKIATGEPRKKRAWGLIVTGVVVAGGTGIATLGAGGVLCGLPMITLGTLVNGREAILEKGSLMSGIVKKTQDVGADPNSANTILFKN